VYESKLGALFENVREVASDERGEGVTKRGYL
jgi:hypothetical protein